MSYSAVLALPACISGNRLDSFSFVSTKAHLESSYHETDYFVENMQSCYSTILKLVAMGCNGMRPLQAFNLSTIEIVGED